MERRLPPPLPSERALETPRVEPRAEPPPLPVTTTTTTTVTTTTTGPVGATPPPVPKPSTWEQIQKTVGDASKCVQGVSQVFSFLGKHLGNDTTAKPAAPAPNMPQMAMPPQVPLMPPATDPMTMFGPPMNGYDPNMMMGYDPNIMNMMNMGFDPNMMMGYDPNMMMNMVDPNTMFGNG